MPDYRILDISFSLEDKVEEGSVTTNLIAHVSYKYIGLNNEIEYGTVLVPVTSACEVTYDSDGIATAIITKSTPTYSDIMSLVTTTVEDDISSILIKAEAKSFKDRWLAEVKSLKSDNDESWPSRFEEGTPKYKELDNYKTGIGQVGYNILDL